jgi:hypothetical protein
MKRKKPVSSVELGPDENGHYHYLGDPANLVRAGNCLGHLIHSQADLQKIAPILRQDRTWSFDKPQTYVVTTEGVFVLGGHLNEHVDVAGGKPVLAAGEAVLEEENEVWHIVELNNRSYGYMPDASCWQAVDKALCNTAIDYPRQGFTAIYPVEGTWADVLAILRT